MSVCALTDTLCPPHYFNLPLNLHSILKSHVHLYLPPPPLPFQTFLILSVLSVPLIRHRHSKSEEDKHRRNKWHPFQPPVQNLASRIKASSSRCRGCPQKDPPDPPSECLWKLQQPSDSGPCRRCEDGVNN